MQCNICGSHLEEKVKTCPYCEADISSQFIDDFKHSKRANDLLGTGDYKGQGDLKNEGKTKPDNLSVEEAENNRKIEVETKRYRYIDPSFIDVLRSKMIKDQVRLCFWWGHPQEGIRLNLSDVDAEKLLLTGGFQYFDLFNGKVVLEVSPAQLGLLYWLGFEDLTSRMINALPEVVSKKENLHYWHLYLNGKTEESITTYYKTDSSKRIEPNHLFFAYCCLHDESEVLSILAGRSYFFSNDSLGFILSAAWFFGVVLHNIEKSKDLLSKELSSWNNHQINTDVRKYLDTANVRKLVFNDSDYIKQILDQDNTDINRWVLISFIQEGLSEIIPPYIENLYARIFSNEDSSYSFPSECFKLSSVFILSEGEIQQRIEIQEINERIDIEAASEEGERNGYGRDETALIEHYIEYAKRWKNLLNHNEKAISCLKKAEVIYNRSPDSLPLYDLIEIANIWQLNFKEQSAYERAMVLARRIADSSSDYLRLAEEYCRINNAFRNELVGKEHALIAEEKAKYFDDFIFLARFWFLSFQDMNKVNECFMKAESFISREQDEYYLNQQKEIWNTSNYFKIY